VEVGIREFQDILGIVDFLAIQELLVIQGILEFLDIVAVSVTQVIAVCLGIRDIQELPAIADYLDIPEEQAVILAYRDTRVSPGYLATLDTVALLGSADIVGFLATQE
jgi:hypothetical protein